MDSNPATQAPAGFGQAPRHRFLIGFLAGLAITVILFAPAVVDLGVHGPAGAGSALASLIRGATGLTVGFVVVLGVAWIVLQFVTPKELAAGLPARPDALQELRLRFVRGEINERDYKRMQEVLTHDS